MMDPKQVESVRAVTKLIKAKLTANYDEYTITLALSSDEEQAIALMRILVEQFTTQTATQLGSFFGIQGELVEIGKSTGPAT